MATPPQEQQRPLPDEKNTKADTAINITDDEVSATPSDSESDQEPSIPWTYKWVAFLCIILFPVGSTWTRSSLGPLKNTLRKELGINNTQFGVISSADSLVNTILPILGGMTLDWWGPNRITLCCTTIIFVGSALAAGAIHLESWRVLAAGHVLMGFGVGVLDQAQQKFVYHWFGASGLAFAFGIENAFSSAVGMVAGMVAIPIRDETGWYGWTFWIPAFFCGFSLVVNIAYIFFERFLIPKHLRLTSARVKELKEKNQKLRRVFSWQSLLGLPWQYLMLPGTQIFQSSGANRLVSFAADMIHMKGYSEKDAGFMSTGQKVLRILLSPVLGWLIDRYGRRFYYVAGAPIMYILSYTLIRLDIHPLVAILFQSLGGLTNAMPLNVCIPLLVADQDKLGTAYGLWKAFNNSAETIMDVVYGILQDGTKNMGYSKVLNVACGIKAVGFALGVGYIILDHKKFGQAMALTREKREKIEAEIAPEDRDTHPLTRRDVKKPWTIYILGMLVALTVTAWAVFIKYLL